MTFEQISTLLQAGFTHDEIISLTNQAGSVQNVHSEGQDPVEETANPVQSQSAADVTSSLPTPPEQTQSPQQAAAQPVPAQQPGTAEVLEAIAKLTSAVQANAIASSQIPGGAIHKETAEDVLGSIINPTFKKQE